MFYHLRWENFVPQTSDKPRPQILDLHAPATEVRLTDDCSWFIIRFLRGL